MKLSVCQLPALSPGITAGAAVAPMHTGTEAPPPTTQDVVEAGYGYAKSNSIRFVIEGQLVIALPNSRRGISDKAPGWNLVTFDEKNKGHRVGAAWSGSTKNQRAKMRLKIGTKFYTAVVRDSKDGTNKKQADLTVFK